MNRAPLRAVRSALPLAAICASVVFASPARAQAVDPAPALALSSAHREATDVLRVLVARLPSAERRKLTGIYVAFDPSVTDVGSMAACDDDGDYVVVMSDALLGLADFVAQAEAADEVFWTHKLDDYATFLGATQPPGTRTLPPPPGFFDEAQARSARTRDLASIRYREILAGIAAHELAHLLQGELLCPNPTATHERGDDDWTREEREHGLAVAEKLYTPPRVLAADGEGIDRLLDAGFSERGPLAWLSTLDRVERAERARALPPSTYLRLHEGSGVRADVVRAEAIQWRQLHLHAGSPDPRASLSPPMSVDR